MCVVVCLCVSVCLFMCRYVLGGFSAVVFRHAGEIHSY